MDWRSPKSFGALALDSIKYGYFWVFTASLVAFGWAFYSSSWQWGRAASLTLLGIAAIWEAATLRPLVKRTFSQPTEAELEQPEPAEDRRPSLTTLREGNQRAT